MRSRERALATFAHREPDRIPIDLGSHGASQIRREVYDAVRALWGIPEEPDLATVMASGLVTPGEAFRQRIGGDFLGVGLECLDTWAPTGEPGTFRDEWGVTWVRMGQGEPAVLEGPLERSEITIPEILDWDGYPAGDDPRRGRKTQPHHGRATRQRQNDARQTHAHDPAAPERSRVN